MTSPLRPQRLRTNGFQDPLAVAGHAPSFAWSFAPLDDAASPDGLVQAVQQRYRLRVFDVGDADTPEQVWDSGWVVSTDHTAVAYDGPPLGPMRRLSWQVQVADRAGVESEWSEPAQLETGPGGRADFHGQWVGPDAYLTSDPMPAMGDWIAPAQASDSEANTRLHTRFELPEGYPRCFGFCWIAALPGVVVELNGKRLDEPAGQCLDHPERVGLPWELFRRGTNTLAVIGSARALASGVSLIARVHEAFSGWHDLASSPSWFCKASDSVDTPVVRIDDRGPLGPPLDNGPRRAVELSRPFELDSVPESARVYVSGLGCYELEINGKRVGVDLFAPGWTDYIKRVQFAAHDVTALLQPGTNRVTATLGNGWWSSGMGWESTGIHARPGQTHRLLLDLVAFGRDGEAPLAVVSTDADWAWRPSATTHDTIYHGQCTDLNAPPSDWRGVSVLEGDGFEPELVPEAGPPIRVTTAIEPSAARRLDDGQVLFDFGQNHAGRPRLRGGLPRGTALRLRYCEELDENDQPYYENYRTAGVTDRVVVGDDPLDWSPAMTYRGYRYAVLHGLPDGTSLDGLLVSEVLHNDAEPALDFRCDNERFNAIHRIMHWGVRSNLHSVPTDCPQRDERLGWTGDVNLAAQATCWHFDLHAFYKKWLTDLIDAQIGDGKITHIAPYLEPILPPDAAPVWADIITGLPTVLDRFYADRGELERCYGPMRRWVDWFAKQADDGLALVEGFGDWVPVETTPPTLVSAAYYAYSSRLCAQVARRLGCDDDADRYGAQAQQAADAFHRHYFDASQGHYTPNTQTAQILPLAFDLTPPELRETVAAHLAKQLRDNDHKLTSGFVGSGLLLTVLSKFGYHDLAYRVLDTHAYPSLGYMIDQGATTVWERWNSDKEGPDMNSRNHFCLGTMSQWLYEDLAGLRMDDAQPGGRRVLLCPRPVGNVRELSMSYRSVNGMIRINWSVRDGVLAYEVDLPANMTALLTLPGEASPIELGPGRHTFDHAWPDDALLADRGASTSAHEG